MPEISIDDRLNDRLNISRLPTPMERHDSLSDRYGVDFYLKRDDLTDPMGGGPKLRRLEYIIKGALKNGCTDIITIGRSDSNQFRILSSLGRKLGLDIHLLVYTERENDESTERSSLFLSRLLCAEIIYLSEKEWKLYPLAVKKLTKRLEKDGRRPCFVSLGSTEISGVFGTINLASELIQQIPGSLEKCRIVLPAGTGATLFGLDTAFQIFEKQGQGPVGLVGMSVHETELDILKLVNKYYEDFNREFESDFAVTGRVAIQNVQSKSGYERANESDIENIIALARDYGIVLDYQYQLRPFVKLLDLLDSGVFPRESTIVFIITGGAYSLFDIQSILQKFI